ncbi:hypothetical protein XM38_030080 [Halomicronema hongdechloris C2206]|uniref:Sulfotransferase n=1 Tax=Halomicronema hongdechloris C2206 TaxID=1641165 RepID=A0A1Z3HP14_9CYAN|nr:sulfotransferase [Halomicronema hongdechloris]ASC72054.1 hypothetical protein XM38_030080 [Halomicronema hongdechloris C2206]
MTTQPIFIVGVPRSGTTLMTTLLSAHARVAISPETHFLDEWLPRYQHWCALERADHFQQFWQNWSSSQRFSYFGVDPEQVFQRLQAQPAINFKVIFQSLLEEYAISQGKSRWGEKTPMHYRHLQTLLNWYPNARVIWMIRDPRATVASLLPLAWASNSARSNAQHWLGSLHLFETRWRRDHRVLLVRYEDLVTVPESTLVQVCKFIGEVYDPSMITNRSEQTCPVINRCSWAERHLKQALQPISQQGLHKWKRRLSRRQVVNIELITRSKLETYGYQLTVPPWFLASWHWASTMRSRLQLLNLHQILDM